MRDRLNLSIAQHGSVTYLPLREVASLVRREVVVDPEETYTEIGVRSFNKGTFHRRTVKGAEFTWQGLYRINQDDLIFSNIMAWEGAVALARPEDDGCLGNHRMLTCVCDPKKASARFLAYYFQSAEGRAKLVAASTGSIARNRTLTASALEQLEVPVPPLPMQVALANRLHLIEQKTAVLIAQLDAIEADSLKLLTTIATRCDLNDAERERRGWRRAAIRDFAALELAPQSVDASLEYPNIGILSYAKGLFAKPPISGRTTSAKTLYQIREGQFIYSRLFAFEGAYALVPAKFDGYFVSNEFPTFRVDPTLASSKFLMSLFLTESDWHSLRASTKGVGDRRLRIQPENLLARVVWLPPLHEMAHIDRLFDLHFELKAKHASIREANSALVPAMLERIFESGRGDKLQK